MKTDDLIIALVADRLPLRRRMGWRLAPMAAGMALACAAFLAWLNVRPDIGAALESPDFLFKIAVLAALALTAGILFTRSCRAEADGRLWSPLMLVPLLLLGGAIAAELATTPADQWWTRLVGSNATLCISIIPVLAIAPLAGTLFTLRRLAPAKPALAGAIAGLLSGAVAALLYGVTCIDDSPLFIAVWYPIALGIVTATGAIAGRFLLRW